MFARLRHAISRRLAIFPELEAGRYGRRLAGWTPSRAHINTLIGASGRTVVSRARFLVRNNGYAMGAVECFAANLIGAGIVPSWKMPEKLQEQKQKLQDVWTRWTDECDAEGVTDFYGLQRRIGRELFIAGECFVCKRPRYLSDGFSVPLQLELLPSEQLPIERNLWLANGNRVRQGIEFDKIGRRVAYHFWKVHPGDVTQSQNFGIITVIPAEEVLHIHDPIESGQIRGLPRLTPAIVPLWSLDAYDDAELERKKTAALFSVFIKRTDPTPTFLDKLAEQKAKDTDGVADVELQPGTAHQLLPGEDVSVAGPADVGPSYEMFQYRSLTKFCAAVGLPYAGVTGDVTRANYGSQRAAMLESRRRLEALQHGVIVYQCCRRVAQWFIEAGVLAGTLDLPDYAKDPAPYRNVTWIPPRWDWIDPLKDRQAEVIAVNNGFKARDDVIEAEGGDPQETDRKIATGAERARKNGIAFVGTPSPAAETGNPPPQDEEANPDNTDGTAADPYAAPDQRQMIN